MDYNYSEGSFASSGGAREIAYYIWSPPGTPSGVVQISHGMREYIGRYRGFAEFLCAHGFALCGNDHIGHGQGVSSDGGLGHIPRRGGGELLVSDLYNMTSVIRERFPRSPIFLLGHSMGAFIASLYITKYSGELSGVILSGMGDPKQPTGAGKLLALIAGIGGRGRRRVQMVHNIAFDSYNKRFADENSLYSWISRDKDIVEKYTGDRLCTSYIFTTDAFYTLFDMLGRVSSKKWARSVSPDIPVLLASGMNDPVGNYGAGVREFHRRLLSAGCEDVTLWLYPEHRHEILNEIGRERIYGDILDWITERLPGAGNSGGD